MENFDSFFEVISDFNSYYLFLGVNWIMEKICLWGWDNLVVKVLKNFLDKCYCNYGFRKGMVLGICFGCGGLMIV